jgi:hypothetical protein
VKQLHLHLGSELDGMVVGRHGFAPGGRAASSGRRGRARSAGPGKSGTGSFERSENGPARI